MSGISELGLKGEADFLRRHNNRLVNKEKRIKSIKIRGFHLFFIFLLILAIGFSAYKSAEFLLTWDQLNIQNYSLQNSPVFSSDRVKSILENYTGNILSVNLKDLRDKLLSIHEIENLSLCRKLPSTIEIRFALRKPVFQVEIEGKYYIIDLKGVVLHVSKTKLEELIEIKHIKKTQLAKLVPYLEEMNKIKDSISYLGYSEPYGILLKLKGINELFYPGEGAIATKINYYLKLRKLPLLSKYKIKNVDLRFENRFYLEFDEEVVY